MEKRKIWTQSGGVTYSESVRRLLFGKFPSTHQKQMTWNQGEPVDGTDLHTWKLPYTCMHHWTLWQTVASPFLTHKLFLKEKEYFAEKKNIFSPHGHLSSLLISVKIIVIDNVQDSYDGEFGRISTDTSMARVKETDPQTKQHTLYSQPVTQNVHGRICCLLTFFLFPASFFWRSSSSYCFAQLFILSINQRLEPNKMSMLCLQNIWIFWFCFVSPALENRRLNSDWSLVSNYSFLGRNWLLFQLISRVKPHFDVLFKLFSCLLYNVGRFSFISVLRIGETNKTKHNPINYILKNQVEVPSDCGYHLAPVFSIRLWHF